MLLLFASSCDKGDKRESRGIPYPGDKMATDTAELFAPGLISTDSFEHSAPAFSPDGKTIFWSVVEMPSWKAHIMEMNYENGSWSAPHEPAFSDPGASDIYPAFSPDGRMLYFSSSRNLPSGQSPSKGNVLWTVEKTETGWSVPQPLDTAVSSGGEYSPSTSTNGNVYFTFGPFRSPDWNIFKTESNNGSYTPPIAMPLHINTAGYEDGPCIAPDESYLIFESDRPEGIEGSIDLYISFRSQDGIWSKAINMGPEINSGASERFARLSPDGKTLFFGSNKRKVDGKQNFDIYWIESGVILALKEKASWSDDAKLGD